MDAITTAQASKNLDQLVEQVIAKDDSKAWQETLYLLSNPANAAHLQKSIQELEQGRVFEKTGLF
ncbi:MAG: type II toxin-antitoxin system Phd/YefM family antitoxin [Methylobacter sp.]